MNDNDMANMIKKAQEMINNNQIPNELKNLVKNMQTNSANSQNNRNNPNNYNIQNNRNNPSSYNSQNNHNNPNNYNSKDNFNKYSSSYAQKNNNNDYRSGTSNSNHSNNEENSSFPNIDIETMMKIQSIMSKMKSFNNDDDMSKLLISLKPYLRNEKKEKVDEYIKLIKMGKMTQAFDLFGGDKN